MTAGREPKLTDFIAEAITEAFGDRCPDYAEGCPACDAWKQYDDLRASPPEGRQDGGSVTDAMVERALNAWNGRVTPLGPDEFYTDYLITNMRAALEAALAQDGGGVKPLDWGETAWLIELRGNEPKWWTLDPKDEPCWTKDSLKALRFARKIDADAYILDIGWTEAFATEHMWPAHRAHDWFDFKSMKCCRSCGNVWNATSDTRSCKGPAKVGPRSALTHSTPVEAERAQIIEECAKVAEADLRTDMAKEHGFEPYWHKRAMKIAADIRALAAQPLPKQGTGEGA